MTCFWALTLPDILFLVSCVIVGKKGSIAIKFWQDDQCENFPNMYCINYQLAVTIPKCYKDVYVNSFFPHTARPWNSLTKECFCLTYDLSGFKSRINRHLLTEGSF